MVHEAFMKEALKEAEKAYKKDEVPVGAVVVLDGKIVSRAHNLIRMKKDPTAHAEILALRNAARKINNERLLKASLYVNIEPCAMCAGALVLSRIETLIYGADENKTGACGSNLDVIGCGKNNHRIKVVKGVLKEESSLLMRNFFREKRVLK